LLITVQYEAWKDKQRIFEYFTSHSANQIKPTIEQLKKELDSGTLNIARQRFGMPPIIPSRGFVAPAPVASTPLDESSKPETQEKFVQE
jgi:hypothetical protein